jgi:hypothetical protein
MHTTIKQRRGINQQGTDHSAGNVANLQRIRGGKVQLSGRYNNSLHRNAATFIQKVRYRIDPLRKRVKTRRNQLIQLFNCCALVVNTVGFIVTTGIFQAFLGILVLYFIAAIVVRTKR